MDVVQEQTLIQHCQARAVLLKRCGNLLSQAENHAVRLGDRALTQLLTHFDPLIKRFARQYQPYGQTIEDTYQAAIESFIGAVHSFDPCKGARLVTWAFFKIRGFLQRHLKKEIHERQVQAKAIANPSDVSSVSDEAPCAANSSEVAPQLQTAIAQLTPLQQQIVAQRMEGKSHLTIAQQMGRSVAAVKQAFHRAIVSLRSLLQNGAVSQSSDPAAVSQSSDPVPSPNLPTPEIPQEEPPMKPSQPALLPASHRPTALNFKLARFFHRNLAPMLFVLSFAFVLVLNLPQPADAACGGWLCGVLEKLNSTEGFKDGKTLWTMIFVGLQSLIIIVFGIIVGLGASKAQRAESYAEFIGYFFLFMIALFGTNSFAGYMTGT